MMREFMLHLQQSAAPGQPLRTLPVLSLPHSHTLRLAPVAHVRCLLVTQGRLWVTGVPTDARGGDVWAGPGDTVRVPAGATPVLESSSPDGEATHFLCAEAVTARAATIPGPRAPLLPWTRFRLPLLPLPRPLSPPHLRSCSCMAGAWAGASGAP